VKLKVTLSSDLPISLPLHYNYTLQGFIYKNLPSIYSTFLHDYGFPYGKRLFKLLTFSRLFGRCRVLKAVKKIVFSPPIYFYVSCTLEELLASHAKELIKREELKLGANRVYLESVELIEEEPKGSRVSVKTLSPVTIHSTVNGRALFYGPSQQRFFQLLTDNLRKKATIARAEGAESVRVLPHPESNYRKVVALYKGFPVEGWKGKFLIEGSPEAIKVALSAGIGDRNSQGFGMIILEGENRK
jgi:CRISPR-associated endoribonuclease Cas6